MKKSVLSVLYIVLGLGLAVSGLLLVKCLSNPTGIMETLPYIMAAIGCGIFGSGVGSMVNQRVLKKAPEVAKKMEIETKDERNVMIANMAKAKAFDIMTYVFGGLMLTYALLDQSVTYTVLLVMAYLFIHGCGIYYRIKYDKKL